MEEEGYFALLLGLLIQAINDFYFTEGQKQKNAEAWIFQGADAPIKFSDVCHWLDLDEDYLRRLILNRKLANSGTLSLKKSKWLFGNRKCDAPVFVKREVRTIGK